MVETSNEEVSVATSTTGVENIYQTLNSGDPLNLPSILSKVVQHCSNINNSSEMKIQQLLDLISCLDIAHEPPSNPKWIVGELARKFLLIEQIEAKNDLLSDHQSPLNDISTDSEIIELLLITFRSFKSLKKSIEPIIDCIQLLSSSIGITVNYYHLVQMFGIVDQMKRYSIGTEERSGTLRSYISSYFHVLCDILNNVQVR